MFIDVKLALYDNIL